MNKKNFEEVIVLEELLRVNLSPEKRREIAAHLGRMLEFCKSIDELDIERTEPFFYREGEFLSMREDIPEKFENPDFILRIVPERLSNFIKVPSPIKEVKKT